MTMISLFDTLKSNKAEHNYEPATDSAAQIILAAGESTESEYSLPRVQALVPNGNKPYPCINPKLDQSVFQWKLSFTNQRIILWSPMTLGLLDRPKRKPGAAFGGHIRYRWIDKFLIDTSNLSISLEFTRRSIVMGDEDYAVLLYFADSNQAKQFTTDLVKHLRQYQSENGGDMAKLEPKLSEIEGIDWNGTQEYDVSLLDFGASVKYLP